MLVPQGFHEETAAITMCSPGPGQPVSRDLPLPGTTRQNHQTKTAHSDQDTWQLHDHFWQQRASDKIAHGASVDYNAFIDGVNNQVGGID